jgi:hypothetical protein
MKWFLKIIKGIGRVLVDLLYILIAVGVAAYVLSSFGMIGAVIMTIPVWYALSWIYARIQTIGNAST